MTNISPQSSSDTPIGQPVSSEVTAEVSETGEFQGVYKDTLSKAKKAETYNASPDAPEFPPSQTSSKEATEYAEQKRIDSALLFAQIGAAASLAKQMEVEIEKQKAESDDRKHAEAMSVMDREALEDYVRHDLKLLAEEEQKQPMKKGWFIFCCIFFPLIMIPLAIVYSANKKSEESEAPPSKEPDIPPTILPIGAKPGMPPSIQPIEEDVSILPITEEEEASILPIIDNPTTLPISDEEVITIDPKELWDKSDLTKKLLLSQLMSATGNELINSPAFETFKQEKDYAALLDQIPIALASLSEESQIRKTGQVPDLFIYQ